MIMEIHSSFGKLICTELEKQAIENSIPEVSMGANQDTEATAGDQDIGAVSPAPAGSD